MGGGKCGLGARAFRGKLPPKTSLVSPSRAPFQDRLGNWETGGLGDWGSCTKGKSSLESAPPISQIN